MDGVVGAEAVPLGEISCSTRELHAEIDVIDLLPQAIEMTPTLVALLGGDAARAQRCRHSGASLGVAATEATRRLAERQCSRAFSDPGSATSSLTRAELSK